MKTSWALDISNYSGRIAVSEFERLKGLGWDHVIVRLSTESKSKGEISMDQLRNAREGGLGTSGYGWCYWQSDPYAEADGWMRLAVKAGVPLDRVWLDLEDAPGQVDSVAWCKMARRGLGMDQPSGLYTGRWWFDNYGIPPRLFSPLRLPFWLARYDGIPDVTVWDQFGPWRQLAGKQYTNGDPSTADVWDVPFAADASLFRRQYAP